MVRQAGIEPALPCLWCGILDLNQYIKMLLTSIPQRQVPYHLATGAYYAFQRLRNHQGSITLIISVNLSSFKMIKPMDQEVKDVPLPRAFFYHREKTMQQKIDVAIRFLNESTLTQASYVHLPFSFNLGKTNLLHLMFLSSL